MLAQTINPYIHYMKQLKQKYCHCRPLLVTFAYNEFSTLSCVTKLEKYHTFVPNIPETEDVHQ